MQFHIRFIFFIGICLIAQQVQAQKIQTLAGKKVKVKTLNKQIQQIMDSLEMPGLSIAIINDAEMVYHQTFGVVNAESRESVTETSIFEGASLSKPIFAYFVMKMVEKGIIQLDAPMHAYFPHPAIVDSCQEAYRHITPRMVLSHSTGFPNHSQGQLIALSHQPGEGLSYSGEAYQYLAAIVGMQQGVGWKAGLNDIFNDAVTKPLDMDHTSFLWTDYLAAHKVYGHNEAGKPTDNGLGGWNGKTFNAFSSVHSEAAEFSKFIIAMLKREGLSEASFDEMLTPYNQFSEEESLFRETGQTAWGLGFAQKPTPHGLMHLHTGNNHDFQAYCMFVPEQQYGLVLFTNSDKMSGFLEVLGEVLGPQF